MAGTPKSSQDLVENALFGMALKKQLRENFSKKKTIKDKKDLIKAISGKVIDKYKLWRMKDAGVISYKRVKNAKISHGVVRKNKVSNECARAVVAFYEGDSYSRLGAGKKEYITRKQERKQKRYVLQSLLGLYEKFHQNKNFKLSYQTFCRLRPFWIVAAKIDQRDTCLCIMHANIDLKFSALCNARILNYNNYHKLLQELCCDRYNEQCLTRECQNCVSKNPFYKEFDNRRQIIYKKWSFEKQQFIDKKTNKTRHVTKYVKTARNVNPRNLIIELHEDLKFFFCHERNIVHHTVQ